MQIIKKYYKYICVICFLTIFYTVHSISFTDDMKNTIFIISTGNELIKCSLENDTIKSNTNLLHDKNRDGGVWPTYDRKNRLLYFEAPNEKFGRSKQIFSIELNKKSKIPIKVLEGRSPSISPNGSLLAYYQHPNQLWLFEIKSQKKKKVISNLLDYDPVVWISDQHLLFTDTEKRMMKLDVVTGEIQSTGHKHVIPGALSPDMDRVLCGSYDGNKIFLYFIKTNDLVVFKKTSFFSMGTSFVWSLDGNSFLYTKQTLSNVIKLLEIRSLFLSTLDGKETKLINRFALFGGFAMPPIN